MEGTFELLGPLELLQLLSHAGQSGAFKVPGGEVYLDEGRPTHAHYKGKEGKEGLFQILALKEGKFRYAKGEKVPIQSLQGPLENYLLQAIQFIDTKLNLSPFDQVELSDQNKATHLTLAPDDFQLIKHLNKPISLIDLSSASGLSMDKATSSLSRLARVGLIQVTKRTPRTVRLTVSIAPGAGNTVRLDARLLHIWRENYGSFDDIEIKAGQRSLRIPVEPMGNAGARLMVSADAVFFYNLNVGQDVLVWPAL